MKKYRNYGEVDFQDHEIDETEDFYNKVNDEIDGKEDFKEDE